MTKLNFRCELCKWYRNGLCLRKPPTVFKIDGVENFYHYESIWPYVKEDDYCAEFVEKAYNKNGE